MSVNRRYLLIRRPHGMPVPEDFSLLEAAAMAPPLGDLKNAHAAIMRLFSGRNTGKLILKIA